MSYLPVEIVELEQTLLARNYRLATVGMKIWAHRRSFSGKSRIVAVMADVVTTKEGFQSERFRTEMKIWNFISKIQDNNGLNKRGST